MKLYIKANDYKTVKNLDSLLPAYISKTSLFLQEEINPFYKISMLSAKEIEEKKELLFYDNREIKKIVKGLYFGNSYCEHLLPSPLDIAKAKSHYNDRHHNFVFVFPPIASKINRAKETFKTLKELQVKEVVVNDYGMMYLALSEGFKPILGVNFTKTIKNTFVEHKIATEITKEQFKNQKELVRHLEFEIDSYREFLKSLGIGRVSIENIEFDESFLGKKPLLNIDIYYPYITISNSRACDIAGIYEDKRGYFAQKDCLKYCQELSLEFALTPITGLLQRYNSVQKSNILLNIKKDVYKNKKNRLIWEVFV
jgi:hypothetical protein